MEDSISKVKEVENLDVEQHIINLLHGYSYQEAKETLEQVIERYLTDDAKVCVIYRQKTAP